MQGAVRDIGGGGDAVRGLVSCRNCGTAVTDRFCSHCGQPGRIHNSFRSILSDLLRGAFNFEGRIWRTMPLLIFRPGELTRRYIDGERARLVSPLAMFVFSVFLLFATFEALNSGQMSAGVERGVAAADLGIGRTAAANTAALARLGEQRAAVLRRGGDPGEVDRRIARLNQEIADFAAFRARLTANGGQGITGWAWLDRGIARLRENPDLALSRMQASAHQYSWVLIPLSTPLVAALFLWRRRFGLFDHAIFTIYSISFISLLVVALELLSAAGVSGSVIATTLFIAAPAHMFVQLRGAYGLSVMSAAWRTAVLAVAAAATLLLFTLSAVAMGISG